MNAPWWFLILLIMSLTLIDDLDLSIKEKILTQGIHMWNMKAASVTILMIWPMLKVFLLTNRVTYKQGNEQLTDKQKGQKLISPFFKMLSTLYGTFFPFYMHFKMSSAICFNLDQSKILSSGNGLTHSHWLYNKPSARTPCSEIWKVQTTHTCISKCYLRNNLLSIVVYCSINHSCELWGTINNPRGR